MTFLRIIYKKKRELILNIIQNKNYNICFFKDNFYLIKIGVQINFFINFILVRKIEINLQDNLN